jgi:hypothetical protein
MLPDSRSILLRERTSSVKLLLLQGDRFQAIPAQTVCKLLFSHPYLTCRTGLAKVRATPPLSDHPHHRLERTKGSGKRVREWFLQRGG